MLHLSIAFYRICILKTQTVGLHNLVALNTYDNFFDNQMQFLSIPQTHVLWIIILKFKKLKIL